DLAGIAVDGFEPRTHFLAWLKAYPKQPGQPRAKPAGGVVLAVGVQPGVEQCPALRMLDQEDRDRQGNVAFAALHQTSDPAGQGAEGKGAEPDRHRRAVAPSWVTGTSQGGSSPATYARPGCCRSRALAPAGGSCGR